MIKTLKQKRGITLIALIVTIIVLILLAGISVMMLTGNNGILIRAGEAKEATEIAQLKEQAELIKIGLQINQLSDLNSEKIKQNALVSAIHKEFRGSRMIASKVITEDNKYEIIVDKELNIKVIKHQNTSGKNIILEYYSERVTSAGAVILTVVPTIESDEKTPTYEEYCAEKLSMVKDENDLKVFIVEYYDYVYEMNGMKSQLIENGIINEGEKFSWETVEKIVKATGYEGEVTPMVILGVDNNLEDAKTACVEYGMLQVGYMNQYRKDITITCKKENQIDTKTVNVLTDAYVEFEIIEGGEYEITASMSDGSIGTTTADIQIITQTSVDLAAENTTTLEIQGKNEKLVWTSSNDSVATVQNGVVTGIGTGTAIITVTNEYGDAISNKCSVKVTRILDDIYTGITWTTLSTIAKEISADPNINSNTGKVTKTVDGIAYTIGVGDIKRITIDNEIYQAEILGFKHDDLANASNEGYSGLSKAGISFQLKELMTNGGSMFYSSDHDREGGWPTTRNYASLNTNVYNNLEETVKNVIVTVGKKYTSIDSFTYDSSVLTSNDKLWLLSCSEVWDTGKTENSFTYLLEGAQYKYYMDVIESTALKKKKLSGDENSWFLRTPYCKDSVNDRFFGLSQWGNLNLLEAYESAGISFGFSI